MTTNENLKNSLSKLGYALKIVPAIGGIAYLCGFVIINTYLSKYDFFDENILSSKYLIAGMGFLLLLLPLVVIIISNSENPTDDLSKNWLESLDLLRIVLWYSFFFDVITINNHTLTPSKSIIILVCYSILFLTSFYLTSYASRSIKTVNKILIMLALLVAYHIISTIFLPVIGYMKMIIIVTGIGTIVIIGQIGDGEYSFGKIGLLVIQFLLLASLFGNSVYEKFPARFGGGEVKEFICYADSNKAELFNRLEINLDYKKSFKCKIIYHTDNSYLIKVKDRVLTIDKNLLQSIEPMRHKKDQHIEDKKKDSLKDKRKDQPSIQLNDSISSNSKRNSTVEVK